MNQDIAVLTRSETAPTATPTVAPTVGLTATLTAALTADVAQSLHLSASSVESELLVPSAEPRVSESSVSEPPLAASSLAASSLAASSLAASSLATSPAQMEALAQHMADAYRQAIRFWRDHSSLSAQEAHERAMEPAALPYQHRLMTAPPDQITWSALSSLNAASPQLVVQVWERVKQAALNELQSGDRASRAVRQGDFDTLWRHTQFLALRHELGREWQPRNVFFAAPLDTNPHGAVRAGLRRGTRSG